MKSLSFLGHCVAVALVLVSCTFADPPVAPVAVSGLVKGVITAKGSIWVNGIEYQTDAASVKVDGDDATEDSLKVGMTVEFNAEVDSATGKARAVTVAYESGVKGSVEAVDVTAGTLTVFGQTIQPALTATYEGTADLSSISVGQFVEACGSFEASGVLIATRIEVKSAFEPFKLKGIVSDLDTTAKTLTLTKENGAIFLVTYVESAGNLPTSVVNGAKVRVKLTTAPSSSSVTVVASDIAIKKQEIEEKSGSRAELEGLVSGLSGTDPYTFTIDDHAVQVAKSLTSRLVEGAKVEVRGSIDDAKVLIADKIEVKKAESELKRDLQEVKGTITAVDTNARTLTVTSKLYYVTPVTRYDDDQWTGTDPLAKIAVEPTLPSVELKVVKDEATGHWVVMTIERD